MRESYVERELKKRTEALGGLCLKQTGLAGIPDRLVLLPGGKCFFVETKAPGKKPRKDQVLMMDKLKRIGYDCYVVDSTNDISKVLGDKPVKPDRSKSKMKKDPELKKEISELLALYE